MGDFIFCFQFQTRFQADFTYYLGDVNDQIELERTSSMKDSGMIIDCKLKLQDHIKLKINKAYSMLGILRRNLKEFDVESFISLYQVFAKSYFEYAESVWNPHYMYLVDDLEKVQKRATKMLRQCRRLNYQQRLKFLNLPTLAFRRNRGDMIEVYKILTGKYDPTLPSILHCNINSTTRQGATY